jgi:hypothetical protein
LDISFRYDGLVGCRQKEKWFCYVISDVSSTKKAA